MKLAIDGWRLSHAASVDWSCNEARCGCQWRNVALTCRGTIVKTVIEGCEKHGVLACVLCVYC